MNDETIAQDKPGRGQGDDWLEIALALAAAQGWKAFTLSALAEACHVPLAEVALRFGSRAGVLEALAERFDHDALSPVTIEDENCSTRDRLFDLVMRRIDAMTPYKAAIRSIHAVLPRDPECGVRLGCRLYRSMRTLLEAAGIETDGVSGFLRTKGLLAVYTWTVRAWLADDSADQGPTMKALDRALDQATEIETWRGRLSAPLERFGVRL